jgi:hypothetical protein
MFACTTTLAGMSETHPALVNGLEINVVDDGYVIYDPATDRVHYLNVTSAFIAELCDGTHDLHGIASELATAFSLGEPPIDAARDGVRLLFDEGVIS